MQKVLLLPAIVILCGCERAGEGEGRYRDQQRTHLIVGYVIQAIERSEAGPESAGGSINDVINFMEGDEAFQKERDEWAVFIISTETEGKMFHDAWGRPLRFEPSDAGVLCYSLGEDGEDEQGSGDDIGIRWVRNTGKSTVFGPRFGEK